MGARACVYVYVCVCGLVALCKGGHTHINISPTLVYACALVYAHTLIRDAEVRAGPPCFWAALRRVW